VSILRLMLDILHMEKQLQTTQVSELSTMLLDKNSSRTTQGMKISTKYMDILPRNRREEVEREWLQQAEFSVTATEVPYLYFSSKYNFI